MPAPIILSTSVFGWKMNWVLSLKGLKYFHCIVLNRLPRPVLEKLGINFREDPDSGYWL